MWLPLGTKLLEVGSITVSGKASVPKVHPSHKPQWVRLQDPNGNELHLRNESRAALTWLSQCFASSRVKPLKQYPLMHCMAAAEARADGNMVGIGGWIGTSAQFAWFAEQWEMSEIRGIGRSWLKHRKNILHASRRWHSWRSQCWPRHACGQSTGASHCRRPVTIPVLKQASISVSPPHSQSAIS